MQNLTDDTVDDSIKSTLKDNLNTGFIIEKCAFSFLSIKKNAYFPIINPVYHLYNKQ